MEYSQHLKFLGVKGLIGRKIGMTSIYNADGANIACTVVEVGPNAVTQVKHEDTDGYNSVQLAFDDAKEKNTTKPMKGHFAKAGVSPKRKLVEIRDFPLEKSLGEEVSMMELFEVGEKINVVGLTKGKGFQGVVKRHGFGGVGQSTHGQHNRLRAPGSIGAASYPSKVIKGLRMAGQTGNKRVKIKNVSIVQMFEEKNIILLKGALPGHKGSYVILEK